MHPFCACTYGRCVRRALTGKWKFVEYEAFTKGKVVQASPGRMLKRLWYTSITILVSPIANWPRGCCCGSSENRSFVDTQAGVIMVDMEKIAEAQTAAKRE